MDFDDTLDVTGRCSAAAVVCDSTPLAVQWLVWIKERVHFHLNLTDRSGPSAFVRRSEKDGEEIQEYRIGGGSDPFASRCGMEWNIPNQECYTNATIN